MHHRIADNTVIFAEALELLFFMCAWVLFFSFVSAIHSNTNNTSSIELLNRLSNKHKIVTEKHDSTYNTSRHTKQDLS
jgi:hypothetical protein